MGNLRFYVWPDLVGHSKCLPPTEHQLLLPGMEGNCLMDCKSGHQVRQSSSLLTFPKGSQSP